MVTCVALQANFELNFPYYYYITEFTNCQETVRKNFLIFLLFFLQVPLYSFSYIKFYYFLSYYKYPMVNFMVYSQNQKLSALSNFPAFTTFFFSFFSLVSSVCFFSTFSFFSAVFLTLIMSSVTSIALKHLHPSLSTL